MNDAATIYLVDDEPEFLNSLGHLLRSRGFTVEMYDSPRAFLNAHDTARPGCLVMDLAMEEMDGLALQEELARRCGSRPIIFLSGQATVPRSVAAMKAGAVDFLVKPFEEPALLRAIERALGQDRARRAGDERRRELRRLVAALTERERAVLDLVVVGLLNKEIAGKLGITERTVKFHRSHLMAKLGARSAVELVHLLHRLNDGGKEG